MLKPEIARHPLWKIIAQDLFYSNKMAILLLLMIVFSALGTIWITYQTRLLTAEKSELMTQQQVLQNEYLNLQLEETNLGNRTRIMGIAHQLNLQNIKSEQEVLILD